jgi:phosphoribosylaminoimidazole carboxylase PurE protein
VSGPVPAGAAPRVAILMGSVSDLEQMAEAARELKRFGVGYELRVSSAHRTPAETAAYVKDAEARGVAVFIAGAGMAAHLAGAVAAHTSRPVLGVPLGGSTLGGLDALLSTAQMPRGVPVATLAIGKAGAANAGVLAAQILALSDPALAERVAARKREMAAEVEKASAKAGETLGQLLSG